MNIPDTLSAHDAAALLDVSEQYVRRLLHSGMMKGRQIGKQWVTTQAAVEAYRTMGGLSLKDKPRTAETTPSVKAMSFFSGAMGLDLGLEKAGIPPLLACEIDKRCRSTILTNRPDYALLGDVWKYTAAEMRRMAGLADGAEIDVIVGGPPCQAFSTAGTRKGFEDARGNVFLRYIDLILELRPRYAVIENVRGLLSAPLKHRPHAERDANWKPELDEQPGGALLWVLKRLRAGGYGVSFNLYNAANFGVPQSRERVILICARDGSRVPWLNPTHAEGGAHGLPPWRTLRDALRDLPPAPCDHLQFPEERLRFYRMLTAGQYWKHLPPHLHREAIGNSLDSGGGKTGFLRRLDWDKPSCTLVTSPTMPATDICHPEADRPLSIQEYKRIQQFPDDWALSGSLTDQYRQIGNAVPVGLGEAVGKAILAHMAGRQVEPPAGFRFSRYRETSDMDWMSSIAVPSMHQTRLF